MVKGAIVGILGFIFAGLIGACLIIKLGYAPANADATPSWLEKTIAKTALRAVIRRQAPTQPNPVALTNPNLINGIELYEKNCAVCHGASDGKASHIALGLYQRPPQLAKHGVEDDPEGHTYWKVYHGIRMTGMPSFAKTLSENQIWTITLFLKNMNSLPPQAQKVWARVRSQTLPDED